jgi:hypothetical protein
MKSSFVLPIFICLCHLSLFFIKVGQVHPKLIKKKISIHTIHLIDEPSLPIQKETLSQSLFKETKEKIDPQKQIPKKIAQLKPKPVKKVEKKTLQNAINKSLSKNSTPLKKSPVKKTAKNDAVKSSNEYNQYLLEVSEILSASLILPEAGKVKLAITVDSKGKVVKIVSLFSVSADNLSYLENNLVKLTFPKYKTNEERTFNITFSDEKL